MPEAQEAPAGELILSININLEAPFGQLQRAVTRSTDLVAFGLRAATSVELTEHPNMPDVLLQFHAGTPTPLDQLPAEFRWWVLVSGMRDLIEACEPFLEELWKICYALRIEPGWRTDSVESFLQDLEQEQSAFHRRFVSDKLSRILEAYPNLLSAEWTAAIRSIIGIRNCMVHRRGVVGDRDCNGTGALRAIWQTMRVNIEYEDGTVAEIAPGMVTQQAGTAVLSHTLRARTYPLGSTLHFDTQDFTDIALTLFVAGLQMRDELLKLLADRGIAVRPPQPPSDTSGDTTPENGGQSG